MWMSPERWTTLALVALAGGAGALCRHGSTLLLGRLHGEQAVIRPLATLGVNVVGCAAFGCFWALAAGRGEAWTPARLVVLTGFLGAFTTFSTYGFELATLLRDGRHATAAGLLLAQNLLGVGAALAGIWLGGRLA